MKKQVKKFITETLNEKFLVMSENGYIKNNKLTQEGQFYFNQLTNDILNQVLNIEDRDVNDTASFLYDDRGNDIMRMEEILEFIGMQLVDYISPISRKEHKTFIGVVENDDEYSYYSYGASTCSYDENPDVENPQPYTTTLKDLEYIAKQQENEFEKFETEFDKLKSDVDYHKIVKLLFSTKFYDCNKETQNFLLSVFVKRVNDSKLTTNQEEIIAKFINARLPYSSLSANEKKQISRITKNKMNK